jgi:hypothetical protein
MTPAERKRAAYLEFAAAGLPHQPSLLLIGRTIGLGGNPEPLHQGRRCGAAWLSQPEP